MDENTYYVQGEMVLPREKIQKLGPKSLSNEELLTLILGSGTQNCSVFELSRNLSDYLSSATELPSVESLVKIRGLGIVKATQVLACLELSARYILGGKVNPVKRPEDLAKRLSYLKYEPQEHFVLVSLDSSNNIIKVHELTLGLVNQTQVHLCAQPSFRKHDAQPGGFRDNARAVCRGEDHPDSRHRPYYYRETRNYEPLQGKTGDFRGKLACRSKKLLTNAVQGPFDPSKV